MALQGLPVDGTDTARWSKRQCATIYPGGFPLSEVVATYGTGAGKSETAPSSSQESRDITVRFTFLVFFLGRRNYDRPGNEMNGWTKPLLTYICLASDILREHLSRPTLPTPTCA